MSLLHRIIAIGRASLVKQLQARWYSGKGFNPVCRHCASSGDGGGASGVHKVGDVYPELRVTSLSDGLLFILHLQHTYTNAVYEQKCSDCDVTRATLPSTVT